MQIELGILENAEVVVLKIPDGCNYYTGKK